MCASNPEFVHPTSDRARDFGSHVWHGQRTVSRPTGRFVVQPNQGVSVRWRLTGAAAARLPGLGSAQSGQRRPAARANRRPPASGPGDRGQAVRTWLRPFAFATRRLASARVSSSYSSVEPVQNSVSPRRRRRHVGVPENIHPAQSNSESTTSVVCASCTRIAAQGWRAPTSCAFSCSSL